MELEHDPNRRKSCSQAIHDHRMRLEALPELTLALSDDGGGRAPEHCSTTVASIDGFSLLAVGQLKGAAIGSKASWWSSLLRIDVGQSESFQFSVRFIRAKAVTHSNAAVTAARMSLSPPVVTTVRDLARPAPRCSRRPVPAGPLAM
jgi:hypothetical protein